MGDPANVCYEFKKYLSQYVLIKFFRNTHHFFMHFPRFVSISDDELFNLFELMDTEDSPSFFSVGSSFLSETSRVTSVLKACENGVLMGQYLFR